MRAAVINLRALPDQLDLIDRAAKLLGKSRSKFMLDAACEHAHSVLLDHGFFSVEAAKFQQFVAMLDAPPSVNEGLALLMARKAPWDSNST